MNKSDALQFLTEFINRIDTQDNRATAKPIQYLLQTRDYMVVDGDYQYDKVQYYHHVMENGYYDNYDDAVNYLKEYGYSGKELDEEIDNIAKLYIKYYWNPSQAFLTEQGLNDHVAINRHNLGVHRSYVVHSFRDAEMVNLIKAIRSVLESVGDAKV